MPSDLRTDRSALYAHDPNPVLELQPNELCADASVNRECYAQFTIDKNLYALSLTEPTNSISEDIPSGIRLKYPASNPNIN
jgi:hypothetical protein